MLSLSSGRFATFRCDADLTRSHHATIRFYDARQNDILFALTIDPMNGLARFNQRLDGHWQTERLRPFMTAPGPLAIAISFRPLWITVFLDGKWFCRFFRDFRGRRGIRFVRVHGGVLAETMRVDHPPAEPYLGAPRIAYVAPIDFRIEGDLHPPVPDITGVHVSSLKAQPSVLPDRQRQFDTGARGLSVRLPGRAWRDPDAHKHGISLRIHAADGQKFGAFHLTRHRLLSEIDERLPAMVQEPDAADAVPLLEHIRYAKLLSELSSPARDAALRLADHCGLRAFLDPASKGAGQVPQRPDRALMARIAFEEWRDKTPMADLQIGLKDVAADLDLDAKQLQAFVLQLSGSFCQQDRFDILADHLHQSGQSLVWDVADDDWSRSTALPFRLLAGDIRGCGDLLHRMKRGDDSGWVETACVGYTIRTLLRDVARRVEGDSQYVIREFAHYLQREAADQWGRIPCRQLNMAAAAVVASEIQQEAGGNKSVAAVVLRACALQMAFWTAVDALGHDQTSEGALLGQFRAVFEQLQRVRQTDDRDAEGRALRNLSDLGAAGTERLLRENAIWSDACGATASDNALRRAAASEYLQDGGPVDPQCLRQKLHEIYNSSSKSPYYQLQQDCSRQVLKLLEASAAGTDTPCIPQPLLGNLKHLSSIESRSLGLTLLLTMFTEFLRNDQLSDAAQCAEALPGFRAPKDDTGFQDLNWRYGTLRGCQNNEPGVMGALGRLKGTANHLSGRALELANSVLNEFPTVPAPNLCLSHPAKTTPGARFFDTIVVVTSCHANLATRVPALREGWLKSLRDMDIPYVIVVGKGDTSGGLPPDVICLDAPDDYEGLPQKTLAAVRWVYENTAHSYLLKIDDDCFLNAERYFHSQSYRKFDYYGRILGSDPEIFDRGWHCEKATSEQARYQLDASALYLPYADGGSGYCLSRHAMAHVLSAAASQEGHEILSRSFLEDKIVGELLHTRGIQPTDEDYTVLIKRRNIADGIAVPTWVTGFEASAASPTKLTHLDTAEGQAEAFKTLASDRLRPMLIWPTGSQAALGTDTNALALVSSVQKLRQVANAPVVVVACMRNEKFMLRHFLSHYRALGIEGFLIADNGSDDGTLEQLSSEPDVAVFSAETEYKKSNYGVIWQQSLLAHFRQNRWSVVADADELLMYPGWPNTSLEEHLRSKDGTEVNSVRVRMLDMYPAAETSTASFASGTPFDGAPYADRVPWKHLPWSRGPFSGDETFTSALRHRMSPGSRPEAFVAQKVAVLKYRPEMQLSAGLHYLANARTDAAEMIFAHFKYTAEFKAKAEAEVRRQQHFNNAEEYRLYLHQIEAGEANPFDPQVSMHWSDIPDVRKILNIGDVGGA